MSEVRWEDVIWSWRSTRGSRERHTQTSLNPSTYTGGGRTFSVEAEIENILDLASPVPVLQLLNSAILLP